MLWSRVRSLARNLLHRSRIEEDTRRELAFHIEARAKDLRREGLSDGEALRRARLEFGGRQKYQEEARSARGLRWLDEISADARFASRSFRKSPGFTLVAVLSVATGIGLTTAVFSVADSILLRPLPYGEPEHIVTFTAQRVEGERPSAASGRTFEFFHDNQRVFDAMAAVNGTGTNLSTPEGGQRIDGFRVTPEFFRVMGVAPLHGRDFVEGDDAPGAPAVAVISHSVWQQFFSGDLGLLGEAVVMNDIPHTVVGILPQDFVYGGTRLAVYVPLQLDEDPLYGGANYMVLGRMPAQGDIEGSRADMARIFNVYREANPNALPDNLLGIGLVRFQDAYAENARPLLVVLSGAVGFVLLIACANVANLLMSRTNTRQREIATRVAIGAGSARILRQLVTEGLVLSLCAGVVGVLIARFIIDILVGLSPLFGVMAREASIDFRVLAFSFIISNHFCHYGHALWS